MTDLKQLEAELRFHGRHGSESQDECAARKNREREAAADAISALLADMEALKGERDAAHRIALAVDPDWPMRAGEPCDWPKCACADDAVCHVALDRIRATNVEAENERLRQALDEIKRGGWRPIETAPRDGTRFLGLTKYGVEMVKWSEHEGRELEPLSGWIGVEQDSTCFPGNSLHPKATYQPTHWQPLPDPPSPLSTGLDAEGSAAPKNAAPNYGEGT